MGRLSGQTPTTCFNTSIWRPVQHIERLDLGEKNVYAERSERVKWATSSWMCVTMIATNKRLDRLALKLLRGQSSSSFLIEKITYNRFNMVNIVYITICIEQVFIIWHLITQQTKADKKETNFNIISLYTVTTIKNCSQSTISNAFIIDEVNQ